MRPSTIPNSGVIVEFLTGNTILGIEGIENPVSMSPSRDAMNCNRPMAWAQMGASSDGVIVGVGRLDSRGPMTAPRRLVGTGIMLEIGGIATGREDMPPITEAITPDAIGGTAMGLALGANVGTDTAGASALVGRVADRMAPAGRVGIPTCRASGWPGAGLAKARRADVSKVRQIWMCSMLVIFRQRWVFRMLIMYDGS